MPNPSKPSWHTEAPAADSGNGILIQLGAGVISAGMPALPSLLENPKAGTQQTVLADDPFLGPVRITYELKKNPRFARWFWVAVWAEKVA